MARLHVQGMDSAADAEALVASDPPPAPYALSITIRGARLHLANAGITFSGAFPQRTRIALEGLVRPAATLPFAGGIGAGGAVAAVLLSESFALGGASAFAVRASALAATIDCRSGGPLIGGPSLVLSGGSAFTVADTNFTLLETTLSRITDSQYCGEGTPTTLDMIRFARLWLREGSRVAMDANTLDVTSGGTEEFATLLGLGAPYPPTASGAFPVPIPPGVAYGPETLFAHLTDGSVLLAMKNRLLFRRLTAVVGPRSNNPKITAMILLHLEKSGATFDYTFTDVSRISYGLGYKNATTYLSGASSIVVTDNACLDLTAAMGPAERMGDGSEAALADQGGHAELQPSPVAAKSRAAALLVIGGGLVVIGGSTITIEGNHVGGSSIHGIIFITSRSYLLDGMSVTVTRNDMTNAIVRMNLEFSKYETALPSTVGHAALSCYENTFPWGAGSQSRIEFPVIVRSYGSLDGLAPSSVSNVSIRVEKNMLEFFESEINGPLWIPALTVSKVLMTSDEIHAPSSLQIFCVIRLLHFRRISSEQHLRLDSHFSVYN